MTTRFLAAFALLTGWGSLISGQATLWVDGSCPGGTFCTIQSAIDAAAIGDTILVRPGTYTENLGGFPNGTITIRSDADGNASTMDPSPADTIIDGNAMGSVVQITVGSPVLEGFTLRNGNANQGGDIDGGGILIDSASPTIRNNVIKSNSANQNGGGISCVGGTPRIEGNVIEGNVNNGGNSEHGGGGIFCRNTNAIIEGNVIRNNTGSRQGGGIKLRDGGNATIVQNIIMGNSASEGGAGISCYASSPLISGNRILSNHSSMLAGGGLLVEHNDSHPVVANNVFAGNTATGFNFGKGAGATISQGSAEFMNNVFHQNTAAVNGGAFNIGTAFVSFHNNIFWNNHANQVAGSREGFLSSTSTVDISFCVVKGLMTSVDNTAGGTLYWNSGIFDSDPMFVDAFGPDDVAGTPDDNLRLQPTSPCIDAGDNSAVPPSQMLDLDGRSRFTDVFSVADAGVGTAPIVDMGAYEAVVKTVLYEQKISATSGVPPSFPMGQPGMADKFGHAVESIGDLDGDGVSDLVVGAPEDDEGGTDRGALWILFMNSNGTVKAFQKISELTGGFAGNLDDGDRFGSSISRLGDLDGDGIVDLAVGAPGDDDGASDAGAVWIFFLDADGTLDDTLDHQKISASAGGFGGTLAAGDGFGHCAGVGDLDGDTLDDLCVGAPGADLGGTDRGAVWVLFLNADGTVKASPAPVGSSSGGFAGALADGDGFGGCLASLADLDLDGPLRALAVGAERDDTEAPDAGAVWVLFLDASGASLSELKITQNAGGFEGDLDASDFFGSSLAAIPRIGGPGQLDLAVGAFGDDDGLLADSGAIWIVSLDATGTAVGQQKITQADLALPESSASQDGDRFASALAALGDLDGDGRIDLAVGAPNDDDGNPDAGAVWILFLNDGSFPLNPDTSRWVGGTSAWTDPSNWTAGVPSTGTSAIIQAIGTSPLVTASAACDGLLLLPGAGLTVDGQLDVGGGATLHGSIAGAGSLASSGTATWAGDGTISIATSFTAPTVVQGGPLTLDADLDVAGDLTLAEGATFTVTGSTDLTPSIGTPDVEIRSGATLMLGTTVQIVGGLTLDGSLDVAGDIDLDGDLTGSDMEGLVSTSNSGEVIFGGAVFCWPGTINTQGLVVFDSPGSTLVDAPGGFDVDVDVQVGNTLTLLNTDLTICGRLRVVSGTLDSAGDLNLAARDLRIEAAGRIDVAENHLTLTGLDPGCSPVSGLPVIVEGEFAVGPGGELALGQATIDVQAGGTLRVVGVPGNRARVTGGGGGGYAISIGAGATFGTLEAQHFVFQAPGVAGIRLASTAQLGPFPLDLRDGVFDRVSVGGVLLDIDQPAPVVLTGLSFLDSLGTGTMAPAGTTFNIRAGTTTGQQVTLLDWAGAFGGPSYEDTVTAANIVWGARLVLFTVRERGTVNDVFWRTTVEEPTVLVNYRVERDPDPMGGPGFGLLANRVPMGPSVYTVRDTAPVPGVYRLMEELSGVAQPHELARLTVDGVPKPAHLPAAIGAPTLPVVGSGGTGSQRRGRVDRPLEPGIYSSFVWQATPDADMRLVAEEPGSVIFDATRGPLVIRGLEAGHSAELSGLSIDGRGSIRPALVIEDCHGLVLLDGVEIGSQSSESQPLLVLSGAAIVQLTDCTLRGAGGLRLERGSRAFAHGSEITEVDIDGTSHLESWGLARTLQTAPGSSWTEHGASAPGLATVSKDGVTIEIIVHAAPGSSWQLFGASTPGLAPGPDAPLLLAKDQIEAIGTLRAIGLGPDGLGRIQFDPLFGSSDSPSVYLQAVVRDHETRKVKLTPVRIGRP